MDTQTVHETMQRSLEWARNQRTRLRALLDGAQTAAEMEDSLRQIRLLERIVLGLEAWFILHRRE